MTCVVVAREEPAYLRGVVSFDHDGVTGILELLPGILAQKRLPVNEILEVCWASRRDDTGFIP